MMHCVSVTHHIPFLLASVETSSVCKVRKDFISLIHVNKGHLGHVESVLYSEEPPIQWNNTANILSFLLYRCPLFRQSFLRECTRRMLHAHYAGVVRNKSQATRITHSVTMSPFSWSTAI
jgi:hypothetical protein